MRLAEDRLGKRDTGDGTQQVQQEIVKDLEELLEQAKQQDEQQQGQGGAKGSRQQRSQLARNNRSKQAPGSGQRTASSPASQPKQPRRDARSPGSTRKAEMSKIADLYKDIWGHLPETLRQEMDQYSREQFMSKYEELLKQYYATIAEKGRQKGE
jgi:hypothetical protein